MFELKLKLSTSYDTAYIFILGDNIFLFVSNFEIISNIYNPK